VPDDLPGDGGRVDVPLARQRQRRRLQRRPQADRVRNQGGARHEPRAEGGEADDQQIGEGNAEGNAIVQAAIDGLVDQTKSIERVVSALKLDSIAFESSDSLDAPDKVFQ
jgi:uncharacterized iron-regulated protein